MCVWLCLIKLMGGEESVEGQIMRGWTGKKKKFLQDTVLTLSVILIVWDL